MYTDKEKIIMYLMKADGCPDFKCPCCGWGVWAFVEDERELECEFDDKCPQCGDEILITFKVMVSAKGRRTSESKA